MRPAGSPKTPGSGRTKGTPNKLSLRTRESIWTYIDKLTAAGQQANPFTTLLDLMRHSDDEHIRVACAIALADRLLPKLKAVEHSGEVTQRILTGDERRARIAALLSKRNGYADA